LGTCVADGDKYFDPDVPEGAQFAGYLLKGEQIPSKLGRY